MPEWAMWSLGLLLGGGVIGWVLKTVLYAILSKNFATIDVVNEWGDRINKAGLDLAGVKGVLGKVEWDVQKLFMHQEQASTDLSELKVMLKEFTMTLAEQKQLHEQELRALSNAVAELKAVVKLFKGDVGK